MTLIKADVRIEDDVKLNIQYLAEQRHTDFPKMFRECLKEGMIKKLIDLHQEKISKRIHPEIESQEFLTYDKPSSNLHNKIDK